MRRLALALLLAALLAACSTPSTTPTTSSTTTSTNVITTSSTTTTTTTTSTSTTTTSTSSTSTTSTLPPEPFDPFGASILEMQVAMEEGRLTSEELVDFYLERIDAYDAELTVFVTISPTAREEAIALDAERAATGPRGPLHGIPVVVKDNFDTFDMQTTAGSTALEGFIPPADATQVAMLREAGAIILGKVNMQEWARSIHGNSSILGRTLNPYDTSRNVGGSSAGTAAAVTTEMAPVGLGTDTCGSIRVPSAFNSLWGLRPTVGLSSRAGVIPLSTTEDTAGPMARFVTDLAIVLDATVGTDPADATTAGTDAHIHASYLAAVDRNGLEGARIGVMYSLFGGQGPVYTAVQDALDRMEAAGATLVPVEVPERTSIMGNSTSVFLREWPFATIDYFAQRPGAPVTSLQDVLDSGGYLPETAGRLRTAVAVTTLDTAEYRRAVASRDELAEAITATMDEHGLDAIAYPSISNPPAPVGVRQQGKNCSTASVAGFPAISMPAGLTDAGWPAGVELLGRAFDEATLIRLASGYEAAADPRVWPESTPPLGEG